MKKLIEPYCWLNIGGYICWIDGLTIQPPIGLTNEDVDDGLYSPYVEQFNWTFEFVLSNGRNDL